MNINEQHYNDIDIVALSGRFVMADAPTVREHIKNVIDAGQGKLVIDLEQVSFIDSSACAVLISAFKAMQLKPGRLVLVTSPVVQSLIELTRLHTVFEILPTQAAALKAFSIA